MCYEFSDWSWKLRVAHLARKARQAEKTTKEQGEPVPSGPPPAPDTRAKERESVPA